MRGKYLSIQWEELTQVHWGYHLFVYCNITIYIHNYNLYLKILRQIGYVFPVLFGLKNLYKHTLLLLKDRVYFHFSLELFSFLVVCLYIFDNKHHIWNHCVCSFFLFFFFSFSSSKYTALQTVMWVLYTCIPIIAMRVIKAWFRYWSLCHPCLSI